MYYSEYTQITQSSSIYMQQGFSLTFIFTSKTILPVSKVALTTGCFSSHTCTSNCQFTSLRNSNFHRISKKIFLNEMNTIYIYVREYSLCTSC